MAATRTARPGWRATLARPATWRRGLAIGLPVGLLQVSVNQGDVWLRGAADLTVVVKSLASPMIAVGIAVLSAAWAEAGRPAAAPTPPPPPTSPTTDETP